MENCKSCKSSRKKGTLAGDLARGWGGVHNFLGKGLSPQFPGNHNIFTYPVRLKFPEGQLYCYRLPPPLHCK